MSRPVRSSSPRAMVFVRAARRDYQRFVRPVRKCVQAALRREDARRDWEISVLLTGDEEIAAYHERYVGIAGPTDVLSWGLESHTARGVPATGDVLVSCATAHRQAAEMGHAWEREVCVLAVHGTLHLLGWDDATAEDRAAMQRRVDEIVDECLGVR